MPQAAERAMSQWIDAMIKAGPSEMEHVLSPLER
jgi:hypothetical protein